MNIGGNTPQQSTAAEIPASFGLSRWTLTSSMKPLQYYALTTLYTNKIQEIIQETYRTISYQ